MRLATIQTPAGPHAALLVNDEYVDLHATDPGLPTTVRQLLASPVELNRAAEVAKQPHAVRHPAGSVKLLPPVPDPQKIVCLGLNYSDHAKETNATIPKDPILFSKYATALIGPDEPIVLPAISNEVDFEAELVIVIGKRGRHLTPEAALLHVAGYTVGHDVSARDWQLKKDGKKCFGLMFL